MATSPKPPHLLPASDKGSGRPVDPLELIAKSLPDFETQQQTGLRQSGMLDPLPGSPIDHQTYPGGPKRPIDPGDWERLQVGDPETGLPPGCPVTPLGKDGQTFYFLDTQGAVAELRADASGKGPLGALFAGRSRYLEWAWPRFGRESKGGKPQVSGWDADNCRQALMDACAYKGFFTWEDQVRGRGAWHADDGSIIFHAGDEVLINCEWRPCGVHEGYIYAARPKIGRPTRQPHPAGHGSCGDFLLDLLRTFNWERGELDARLMLGWLVTAKIGGALRQRPVVFVSGGEGSGKSTLQALCRTVMNGALIATSNTTQAGLYQRLQQDSIAILVDEMEAKDDTRTVDKILELARICYSGDKMQRGGKFGQAREYSLSSSFFGSAISKPATDAQDDSRMAALTLRERQQAGGRLDVDRAALDELGRQLMRRILDWWPRWEALNEHFRELMIELGHKDRACDTFAPLAAGAHLAVSDNMPEVEDLAPWREWLEPKTFLETASREKTWQRCFWYLMEATPEALRSGHFKTLGAAIEAFRHDSNQLETLEKVASAIGVAISFPRGAPVSVEHARLFVPFNVPPLHAVFEGTPWVGRLGAPGPWGGVLRQMPRDWWSVSNCEKGLNRAAKGLMIELAHVLGIERAGQ